MIEFMGTYPSRMKESRRHYRFGLPQRFPLIEGLTVNCESEEGILYLSLKPSVSGNVVSDGREVFLPKAPVDISGIRKGVVVVGCGSYFEVWKREKWDEYNKN